MQIINRNPKMTNALVQTMTGKQAMRVNALTGLLEGGAAAGAIRLHLALRRSGVESNLFYPRRFSRPKQAIEASRPAPFVRKFPADIARFLSYRSDRVKLKRALRNRSERFEIFTAPRGAVASRWPERSGEYAEREPEIFHLHWVSKFVDWATFFPSLPAGCPVVWTLHDMNPFTGGCHFSGGCQRYSSRCGQCPQLPVMNDGEAATNDLSRQFFDMKRSALQDQSLDIVAPSRWMMEQAQASELFPERTRFHHIPYGIPLDDFAPLDQAEAREALGLPPDAFVFLFGAAQLAKERKGMRELLAALPALKNLNRNVIGLFFGSGDLARTQFTNELPEIRSVGYVHDVSVQRQIYSAADVFVLPSLEDNLPFTGLESLACGTPVVGFDVGGIPDYVIPEATGVLAQQGSVSELAACLRRLVQQTDLTQALRRSAREFAVAHHSIDREAADYRRLYAAMLERSGSLR